MGDPSIRERPNCECHCGIQSVGMVTTLVVYIQSVFVVIVMSVPLEN